MNAAELTTGEKVVVWFKKLGLRILYAAAVFVAIYSLNIPALQELPELLTKNPGTNLERWATLCAVIGFVVTLLPQWGRVVVSGILFVFFLKTYGDPSEEEIARVLQLMLVVCAIPPLISLLGSLFAEGVKLKEQKSATMFRDFKN